MRLDALVDQPCVQAACVVTPAAEVQSIHCDSRRAGPGVGFLALQGLREDGHRYLAAAAAAGAPVLCCTDEAAYARLAAAPPAGVAGVLLVGDGRRALAELAAILAGEPSRELALYGVTGTNGKTTTTHLVAQLLGALGHTCGLIGTLGMQAGTLVVPSERTTPEAPDIQGFLRRCVQTGADAVAMEVSSIGIALERDRGLHFRAAAFTNLTQDHLDFHGSWDAYRAAKFRLFEAGSLEAAVVNLDDPAGRDLAARLRSTGRPGRLLTFALDTPADLGVEGVQADGQGVRGRLRVDGTRYPFRYPLLGRFNLSNLLAAVGLLVAGGEAPEVLAPAIAACTGARGRFERVPVPGGITVVVDYAHTPDALEHLLHAARPLTTGRLHVVFGCGGDRDRAKRPQMGAIAERLADRVTLTDDNPRGEPPEAILAEIAAGMDGRVPIRRLADRRTAIRAVLNEAGPGDLVLIAGKGDESYQEVAGVKHPFDDRAVVRDWAAERTSA